MTERVLAVVSHPDDETLGCGGTLAKHVRAGDTVMVVVLSDGVGSRQIAGTDVGRRREFLAALRALGVEQNGFSTYPDNAFDSVPLLNIARDVSQAVTMFAPSIVYTHWHGDMNVDHRLTSEAVQIACRPQPGSTVKRLLYFEVPSSTEWGRAFNPNWYEDISATLVTKLVALQCYLSELRQFPHPRSMLGVEYLAKWRGATCGAEAAEAFVVGRICA